MLVVSVELSGRSGIDLLRSPTITGWHTTRRPRPISFTTTWSSPPSVSLLKCRAFAFWSRMDSISASMYGVDGLAICRFKKLNENGTSCNYPTERAEALRRNEPLPGMPEHATYIDVGYVLNPLRTGFRDRK